MDRHYLGKEVGQVGKVLDETKDPVINIVVNGEELDEAIIKANSLVELLREASELICSLYSGTKDQ